MPRYLPFNRDESMTTSPATELIDISSSSGKGFAVELFSLAELDERFRTAPFPLSDMPTAFMGATEAALIPRNAEAQNKGGNRLTPEILLSRTNYWT